ncbi:MAG: hypothetical protein ACOVLC_11565 [Flavobacterium sp.]
MDSSITVIGLIIVLICAVPFVVMYFNNRKKENEMMQSLHAMASNNKSKITAHEFCGDFVLGIDETKKFVYFHKQNKDFSNSSFVNLSQTKECHITKKQDEDVSKSSIYAMQSVSLSFRKVNDVHHETHFELFNRQLNHQLSGELQFADQWSKRINNLLNK